MHPSVLRVRVAVLAALCASVVACNSSPLEVDAEAARGPKLQVSPLQIDFGSTGATSSITLENTTKRAMSWTASESAGWLSLGTTSGTLWGGATERLSVSASRTGLTAGTYTTEVTFTGSNGGGTEVQTVSLTVPSSSSSAQLSVSPLQIDFGSTENGQAISLANTGEAALNWTASESAGWLSLGSTSGSISGNSSQVLSLSVDRGGMAEGVYSTALTIEAGTAGSAAATVSVGVVSTSSPAGDVLLSGRMIDQFAGLGMAGLTVEFGGESATTDAVGSFTITGSSTKTSDKLTVSGSGIYPRVTTAETGDALWHAVPASFDMNAFNDVARDEFGTSTVRWVAAPTVYVDADPQGFDGGAELQTWIAEVQVQAAEFVSKWTGATISPASVIVTSRPPRDFSSGTIVIHFSEEASDYGNTASIGYARLSWNSDRSISGAVVWLRYLRYSGSGYASKRRGILGHELGHAMGLGHMNGSSQVSLMAPSLGSKSDLSAYDAQVARLHYGRRPGNSSPDTDSSTESRGQLAPAGASVEQEWLCGPDEAGADAGVGANRPS